MRNICRNNEVYHEINKHNLKLISISMCKHHLLVELEQLKVSLKYFHDSGVLGNEEYNYLLSNINMGQSFLRYYLTKQTKRHNNLSNNVRKQSSKLIERSQEDKLPTQPTLFSSKTPIPISGEITVSGLNESLKSLKHEATNKEFKFPYKLPAGTHWNNIIIKFLNNEEIEINVKRIKHITNFKEMGMLGKGNNPTPSEQWTFLLVLAKYNGEITIKDPDAKDKYKKHKQALAEKLQNYFAIDYDPFYPYQSCVEKIGNSYKIKILLIPPESSQIKSEENIEQTDAYGIHEFLNSQIMDG